MDLREVRQHVGRLPSEELGMKTNDDDLEGLSASDLRGKVMDLRNAIRRHRDSSGHDLCWYVPELWALLPEGYDPKPSVPPTCEFLERCAAYRKSLEEKP